MKILFLGILINVTFLLDPLAIYTFSLVFPGTKVSFKLVIRKSYDKFSMFVNRQSCSCTLASRRTVFFFGAVSTSFSFSVNSCQEINVHVSSLLVLVTFRTIFQKIVRTGATCSKCNHGNSSISNEIRFLLN